MKNIEKMLQTAEKTGSSVRNRNGVEVYRATRVGDTISLYHYGTEIARVISCDTCPLFVGVYGESKSDADVLNYISNYYNIDLHFGFKPVNGGFYASQDGRYVFIAPCDDSTEFCHRLSFTLDL